MKVNKFLAKVFYSIRANSLELLVNAIVILFVPKFLGSEFEQYGYFQVYLFYVSYVGFFHFGWCDGILLRLGGKKYEELDKKLCASQIQLNCIVEVIFAVMVLAVVAKIAISDYRFVYSMVAFNIAIYTPRRLLQYYLQSTNKIKEYARITEVGRGIYGILLVLVILVGVRDYKIIIISDVIAKTIALLFALYICRDIVFLEPVSLSVGIKEAYANISVGVKLFFSNIASMLVTGIVRWGIQMKWDIATYGKISFSLSVSNFLLSFISAIAVVLYPTLKRVDYNKLPILYKKTKNGLMIFLFACLLLYYPIRVLLIFWLPQYEDSIRYMEILFPVCIYAAKMVLLIQTYMNIYRLEKELMKINIVGVAVAFMTTVVAVLVLENLALAMISIVFNQMFRCIYAEVVLAHHIKIDVIKDIVIEIIVVTVFILFHRVFDGALGLLMYMLCFICYALNKRNTIEELFEMILHIFRKKN